MPFPKQCRKCRKKFKPYARSCTICDACWGLKNKVEKIDGELKAVLKHNNFSKKETRKYLNELKKYYKFLVICKSCKRRYGTDSIKIKKRGGFCPVCENRLLGRESQLSRSTQ